MNVIERKVTKDCLLQATFKVTVSLYVSKETMEVCSEYVKSSPPSHALSKMLLLLRSARVITQNCLVANHVHTTHI